MLATRAAFAHHEAPVPEPLASTAARPGPAVAPGARPRPSLVRLGMAPASLVVCAGLFYALRWPMPGVVAVALVALLASIWIGPLVDRSRAALDRDLLQLLGTGRARELAARVEGASLFRWLGAPGEVAEREGRAYRAVGDRARALSAYQRALAGYEGGRAPLSVVAGLGHAAYEAGDAALARAALGAAHRASRDLPELAARLAHLALMRGDADTDDEEAEGLVRETDGETARLVLALRALRRGDLGPARAALAEIPESDDAAWALARRDLAAELERTSASARPRKRKSKRSS